ncbi:MAG: ABC transporter ATP-binding protein [Anaerolineae bacterium]|nr:ABC transporter ATP-binding protein [Anaerolineae bacterium]
MQKPIIQLKHVSRHFGTAAAVAAVNLAVPRGALVTLLGPSGCGKTTTLRLIAGIQRPDAGEIVLNGRTVAAAATGVWVPPEERRVGLVFQDYALFPHLSAGDNIAFGLRGSRADKQARVAAMLDLVGLPDSGRRMPHELSGGQQQRVALARALAPQPDVLLLDEPFSNLDTALRAQVRAEVRSILRDSGTTAIFVTHDQEEALSLSDEVAVMFAGHLAQVAPPAEVYHRPATPAVAQFVGEANFLPAEAQGSRATCALGDVALHTSAYGRVTVLLRPERLHLVTDGGTPATLHWREYYGHSQRAGLVLADGTRLVARLDALTEATPGTAVQVRVSGQVMAYPAG